MTRLIAINDTGSDILTIFYSDLGQLNMEGYLGWLLLVGMVDANGVCAFFDQIIVEVRMVDGNNMVWGLWIAERALVRNDDSNIQRLSGSGIRAHLYFGTVPGNNVLSVATTKGSMSSLL